VVRLLSLPALPKPDDAADAVAIALTGLRSAPRRRLEAAMKGKRWPLGGGR
jgi:Holliday junction resolvasome RuvABC endonuclease subunit